MQSVGGMLEKPAVLLREAVEPFHKSEKPKYYHRRFRRVPTIDECHIGDEVCFYEANEQFLRDKRVDNEILSILRQKKLECEHYHGPDAGKMCKHVTGSYNTAEANWFMKYGDLGAKGTVRDAYMKQKHRLIWERRHGPVGSGMTVGSN